MNNKLITIIIATYNASNTIKNCLESITFQKTEACELLIIDGDSSDDTVNIVKSYGELVDCFISEPDFGIYDAWNKGIKESNGDWIMFLGADDLLLPNAINDYLNILKYNSKVNEVDYICAKNEYVDKNGKLLKILGKDPSWNEMRKMNVAAHVASLHNKSRLFNEIGLYDLNFKICADYELLLRKGESLKSLFIPNHIARMSAGGMSFSTKAIVEIYRIRALHNSVSYLSNIVLFIINWLKYMSFFIRKKSNLNSIITRLKGEEFILDENIPFTYLARFLFVRGVSLIYGMIRLRTFKRVFVHPSSTIKCPSMINVGKNFSVAQDCYLDALSTGGFNCGYNVSLGYQTHIELSGSLKKIGKSIIIGNNVGLGTHGHYGSGLGGLEIGDDTIIGNYVSFHPENHIFKNTEIVIRHQGVYGEGIKVGKNCWIGAKVTFLDGSDIGDGCIVAAGAVVIGIFPDNCILGGTPAKILKNRS